MKSLSIKSMIVKWLAIFAVTLLASCGGGNDDQFLAFSTTLDGRQETPPNSSPGAGTGLIIVHPSDNTFTASMVTSGVAETAAHIHEGAPGVSGPIIFPLTKESGSVVWRGNGTLTAAQLATLKAGNYYFNVHSPTFPNGEIRGQIQEQFPSEQELQQLQQVQQQSELLRQQLQELRQMH